MQNKLKIVFITEKYYPDVTGGSEKSLKILVDCLAKSIEPVVITLSDNKTDYPINENNCKVYYVKAEIRTLRRRTGIMLHLFHNRDLFNFSLQKKIMTIIDTEKPNLVHTNNLRGIGVFVWPLIKKRGIPIAHTLRDYYLMCPYSSMFWNGKNCTTICKHCRFFALIGRLFSRYVDAVVGNSRYILQRHLKAGYFNKTLERAVIYNAAGINESTKEIFESPYVVQFGFIGRIVPEKGVELILRVLSQLDNQDWTLIIAGSGEESYCASLKKKYTNHRIKWLGWTQLDDFYKHVDCVIIPSLWQEPLSRVIIEAFSYAIPVIASQRGGSTEVIQDGINGFLFDPDDPNSLKKILNRILSKKVDLPENSRNCLKASTAFSEERLRSSYLRLYKALTRNNE